MKYAELGRWEFKLMGNNEKYEGMTRECSIKYVFNKMGSEIIEDL